MGLLGKRRGKVAKGVGQPAASGSASIGGSLSRDDHYYLQEAFGMAGGEVYSLITPPLATIPDGGAPSSALNPKPC